MQTNSSPVAIRNDGLMASYQQLSKSRKFILIVFIIWLIQEIPKWSVAINADGELSAQIMKVFITPRAESSNSV